LSGGLDPLNGFWGSRGAQGRGRGRRGPVGSRPSAARRLPGEDAWVAAPSRFRPSQRIRGAGAERSRKRTRRAPGPAGLRRDGGNFVLP